MRVFVCVWVSVCGCVCVCECVCVMLSQSTQSNYGSRKSLGRFLPQSMLWPPVSPARIRPGLGNRRRIQAGGIRGHNQQWSPTAKDMSCITGERERERAEERREGERGERRGESRERDTRGKQGRQQFHTELSCIAGPGLEVGKPKSASWKYGVRIWFLVIFPSKSRRDLLLRKAMQVIFANMTLAIFG